MSPAELRLVKSGDVAPAFPDGQIVDRRMFVAITGWSDGSCKRYFRAHSKDIIARSEQGGIKHYLPVTALEPWMQRKWLEANGMTQPDDDEAAREFASQPEYNRAPAENRLRILRAWDELPKIKGKLTEQMATFAGWHDISAVTLRRWLKARDEGGRTALSASWGNRRGECKAITAEDRDMVIALYCDARRPLATVAAVHETYVLACDAAGKPHASIGTVRRLLEDPLIQQRKELHLLGKTEFLQKNSPKVRNTRVGVRPGTVYIGDHRQNDIPWVTKDGRIIFAHVWHWQDYGSTAIVGWSVAETPTTHSIVAALYRSLRDWSIPETFHVDNGKACRAKMLVGSRVVVRERAYRIEPDRALFSGIFVTLESEAVYSLPYNAPAKLVENFHSFVRRRYDANSIGDRGPSTAKRPYTVDELIAKTQAALAAGKPIGLHHGTLPTWEEGEQLYGEFVRWYNARPNQAEGLRGRSPNQMWEQEAGVVRRASPAALSLLLCRHARASTVSRQGMVGFSEKRAKFSWYSAELHAHWVGRKVVIRYNPDDLSIASIHDTDDDRYICSAEWQIKPPRYARDAANQALTEAEMVKKAKRTKAWLDTINAGEEARDAYVRDQAAHIHYGAPDPKTVPPGPDLSAVPIELVRTGLEQPARAAAVGDEEFRSTIIADDPVDFDEYHGPRFDESDFDLPDDDPAPLDPSVLFRAEERKNQEDKHGKGKGRQPADRE